MKGTAPHQASGDSPVATRFGDVTYGDVTYKVIGAAMQVHNALGPGLKEIHYHKALSAALTDAGLAFEDEKPLQVLIDDQQIGLLFMDHFVEGAVVVEEKAQPHLLTDEEVAQLITYLAVADAPLGLLLNFGRRKLEYKRVLPPKKFGDWKSRAARYAWRPPSESSLPHPLIRSSSADDSQEPP